MYPKFLTRRLMAVCTAAVACAVCALALATGATARSAHATAPAIPAQDPFYTYSGSLSGVAPGTVLRTRAVSFDVSGLNVPVTTTQVLYRTQDELGNPDATVVTVVRPATATGKIVSYQFAYDGLASNCRPSYAIDGGSPTEDTNSDEQDLMVPMIAAGDTVITADYEGEGDHFAAGREEGYGTLDGIRAAESFLKEPASTQVAMMGYSGGAIATDWAAELASTYAPALNIVGAAEGGIAVDLAHNLTYVNGSQEWSGAIPAALVGISRAFNIDLSKYLSPSGLALANKVGGSCLESDLGSFPGLTYQKLLKPQYTNIDQVEPFINAMNNLTMGTGGIPREPIYMGVGNADGTGDDVMIDNDDMALGHLFCSEGLPVQFTEYKGDDHGTAGEMFLPAADTWVIGRLNGVPATNGCSGIAAGNSLAPQVYSPLPKTPAAASSRLYVHTQLVRTAGTKVTVRVRAFRSAVKGVTVALVSSSRKTLATKKFNAARDKLYTVTLTASHTLAAGTYKITVAAGKATPVTMNLTVRSHK